MNVDDFLRVVLSQARAAGGGVAYDREDCITGEKMSSQRNGKNIFSGNNSDAIRRSTVVVDLCAAQMLRGADISANPGKYNVNAQADSDVLAPWRMLAADLGASPFDNVAAMELLEAVSAQAERNGGRGPLIVRSKTNDKTITVTNIGVVDAFYTLARLSEPGFLDQARAKAQSPNSLERKPAERTLAAVQTPAYQQAMARVVPALANERPVDEDRMRRALAACTYEGTNSTMGGCARAGLIMRATELAGQLGSIAR